LAESATGIWPLIRGRAESDADRIVVTDERGGQLTFSQLRERAEETAAGLFDLGIRPGDVVSWQLPGRIDTIVLVAALSRLGAVQNPLIPMLREREVEFICDQTGSRLLIVPSVFRGFGHLAMAQSLASSRPRLAVLDADAGLPAGDPATLPPEPAAGAPGTPPARWLFYTSGTTAVPKGAKHTDASLLAAADVLCTNVHMQRDERTAALAPIAHVGGILYLLAALRTGSRIVITEIFDQASTPEQIAAARVTLGGSGVPFLQAYLRRQRERPEEPMFPTARAYLVGGSSRPPQLHYEVKNELGGVGVISGYGLTECPYVCFTRVDDPDEVLAVSEGRPVLPVEVKVVDGGGRVVGAGESGELLVRGPQLMLGYVDAVLDGEAFDAEGFFRTGDVGVLDGRGYLRITGRIKDVVIRNMENISAREVEDLAVGFAGAAELAVIGLPDPVTGERVVAVAVAADPGSPPTLGELCAYLRAGGLNPRKLPVQLELVEELPRNAMGKVVKRALKGRYVS
jgi:acyl-CoA synthetase (AMP-forming)/AMP-acid ligase II